MVNSPPRKALFAGLIQDEEGNPVDAVMVGDVPNYVVDDAGFRRHVESKGVDIQVIEMLREQFLAHQEIATEAMLQMLGIPDPDNPLELATADDLMEFTGTETTLREPVSLDHLFSEWWLDEVRLEGMQLSVTEDERVELSAHAHAVGVAGAFTGDLPYPPACLPQWKRS